MVAADGPATMNSACASLAFSPLRSVRPPPARYQPPLRPEAPNPAISFSTAFSCAAMARFFWFPVEFGLMEPDEGLTVYGSGCSGIRFSSNGW